MNREYEPSGIAAVPGCGGFRFKVATAARMQAMGGQLAPLLGAGMAVHLRGALGSGKTTLVRGILRGLGHVGEVPSPTYALVADYDCAPFPVYHLDLYRLAGAQAEGIGIRDYLDGRALCLVEWPERASLPQPDLLVGIEIRARGRRVGLCPSGPMAARLRSGIEKMCKNNIL